MKKTFFRNSIIFSLLIVFIVSFMSIGFAAISKSFSISSSIKLAQESTLKDRVVSTDQYNVKFLGCNNIDATHVTELYFTGTKKTNCTKTCDASANGDGSVEVCFISNNTGDNTGKVYVWGKNGVVFANRHTHFYDLKRCSVVSFVENGVVRFSTKKMVSMTSMFGHLCLGDSTYGCNMAMLDLSSFDTSNVTEMNNMFDNSSGITAINLGSFDTSNVTSMDLMFHGTTTLKRVYVGSQWTTSSVTSGNSMFELSSLHTYHNYTACHNSSTNSYTYAKIDGGSSSPGCFDNVTSLQ